MSLKSCRSCGKPVDSEAKKCPSCGAPDPYSNPIANVIGGIFVVIIIVAMIHGCITSK